MLTNRTRRDVIFNRVPSKADLDAGDLAVNAADGIAYTKLLTGQVVPIAGRSISGESGGPSFVLPVATDTVLGGIKVGANLTITPDGVLSATQGQDGFVLEPATATRLGGIKVGARLTVLADGTLSADAQPLPIASNTVLGGVRVGAGLTIDGAGLLSANSLGYVLPPATNITLGGVKVGANLQVTADGTLSAPAPFTLPIATTSTLGGVRVGSGLTIDGNGTLSVPNDRVLRAGDTMTGTLTMSNGGAFHCALGSFFTAIGGRGATDIFYARSDDNAADFGISFSAAGNTWLKARSNLFLSGNQVSIRATGNGVYDFAGTYASLNRSTFINPTGGDVTLDLRANTSDQSWLRFTSPDGASEYGSLTVNWGRADFWGRAQTWLRGGVSDPTGWVELNGGWNQWEPVRFSRGNQHLASVDGNGNFVRKVARSVIGLRAATPGLAEVQRLQPVAYAAQAAAAVDSIPTLGFLPVQLRQVLPEAVSSDGEGYAPEVLIPVLVKAVQELAARVEALERP